MMAASRPLLGEPDCARGRSHAAEPRASLSLRLLAAAALALFAIAVPLVLIAHGHYLDFRRVQAVRQSVALAEKISGLVHELQKERGHSIAAVLAASAGGSSLAEQRRRTDRALRDFAARDGQPAAADVQSGSRDARLHHLLARLPERRSAIDRRALDVHGVLAFYDETIESLFSLYAELVLDVETAPLTRQMLAYRALAAAKESAGRERAIGHALAIRAQFDPDYYPLFVEAAARHRDNLREFAILATADLRDVWAEWESGGAAVAVQSMRKRLLALTRTATALEVAPASWWQATTAAIDELHGIERRLLGIIAATADTQMLASRQVFWLVIGIEFAVFACLTVLAIGYVRRTSAAIAAGQDEIKRLALRDALTGLANRAPFAERLEAEVARAHAGAARAALIYVDIDRFKDINDTFGHYVGDELIRHVAGLLARSVRDNDFVARLGGDEFAIIRPNACEPAELQAFADNIIAALREPCVIASHCLNVGASVGVAVVDETAAAAGDVMVCADVALYRAKKEGRNRACIYNSTMDAEVQRQARLRNDLSRALAARELGLVYQPIVCGDGTTIMGVEALCRWDHRQLGAVSPVEFIPIAEDGGLIAELGEWVLWRASVDAAAWPDLVLAVNVSPLQLRRLDFVKAVARILEETGLDPRRLELELTESTFVGDFETTLRNMRSLKALGIRFALDDFGAGYSSLIYLRNFEFDRLKIDRGFVASLGRTEEAATILFAIVGLARALGMQVTAEGVETVEQYAFLRGAGVDAMQGLRFGAPIPAPALTLERRRRAGSRRSTGDSAPMAANVGSRTGAGEAASQPGAAPICRP